MKKCPEHTRVSQRHDHSASKDAISSIMDIPPAALDAMQLPMTGGTNLTQMLAEPDLRSR